MNSKQEDRRQLKNVPEMNSKPKPLALPANTPVVDAVRDMCARNYGSVVIVDEQQQVQGIVTERDLMRKLINEGKDPATTLLSDIMTANPRCAKETDQVVDWLRIMSNERFRRVPVVNEQGQLVNIFTQGDFVSYTWPDLLYQIKEGTKQSVNRNFPMWIMVGGIMVYSLMMVVLVNIIA